MTARHMSVCLGVASVFMLWAVARQFLDRRTALICTALLGLSPNFIVEAAEIRAYAAFIFFSTLLIFTYLRLLAAAPQPSSFDLWMFALAATLCSYTHFFGIVISAGAFLCVLTSYVPIKSPADMLALLRKAKWPLLFYLISIIGLLPFILASVKQSDGGDVNTAAAALPFIAKIYDIIKLTYRLFAHQSMLGIPGLSAAAMLAGVTLILFAAIPGSNPRCRPLLLYLLINFSLIAIVGLKTRAFNAFSFTYNVWALPVTALLAATALTRGNRSIRAASSVCIGVLIAADCYAAIRLSTAGEIYGHTRTTVVKSAIDSAEPSNVVVLYGNDAPAIYFAMIYNYHGNLRQYFARRDTVHMIGSPANSSSRWICDRDARTLLVAEDQELSADALQFQISHPEVHTPAYLALDEFLKAHRTDLADKWTLVSLNEYLAQSALALAVYKARNDDPLPSSTNCNSY
jgi:hypothetical protein